MDGGHLEGTLAARTRTFQKEWTPAHTGAGEGARDRHGHPDGTRDLRDSWVLIPALDEEWYQS